jgi:hypothetical protein
MHQQQLLADLDALSERLRQQHALNPRDELATRELISVVPALGFELKDESLGDKRNDVRVVTQDPVSGAVLLDAPSADLPGLRRKVQDYGAKKTKSGEPSHAPAVAPIEHIAVPTSEQAGPLVRQSALAETTLRWFELRCRGGYLYPDDQREQSREQVIRQLERLHHREHLQEFVTADSLVLFTRISLRLLKQLATAVDSIYEYDLAPPEVRDWLWSESRPVRSVQHFVLNPPKDGAPSIAILDTGIATQHPLLAPAILSAASVIPGDTSPEDGHSHGHGTNMAGAALYGDLGAALDANTATARYWIESVRIHSEHYERTPDDVDAARQYRPAATKAAVDMIEAGDGGTPRDRAYVLAITEEQTLERLATIWAQAIDQLAYAEGRGRLICVSAGNAAVNDISVVNGYPRAQLDERIENPSHAANALSIGAYTTKTRVPPDAVYENTHPVAPRDGVSPYTRAGLSPTEVAIKPDVVLEGGNLAFDGALPGVGAETLSTLTTGREFLTRPLEVIFGTSEATARAGRLAAEIWRALPRARAETVRALMVQSARWTPMMERQFPVEDERFQLCGYGAPDEAFATGCAADRATIIFEDAVPNMLPSERPKKEPPKRPTTSTMEKSTERRMNLYRIPFPDDLLREYMNVGVELRVTLSYFAEPARSIDRRIYHGMRLDWDMQGPAEREQEFLARINKTDRPPKWRPTQGFNWTIGPQRRNRGTVQSDRCFTRASALLGGRLLAVMPIYGWWKERTDRRFATMPFSVVISIVAPGIDIYTPISAAIAAEVPIPT